MLSTKKVEFQKFFLRKILNSYKAYIIASKNSFSHKKMKLQKNVFMILSSNSHEIICIPNKYDSNLYIKFHNNLRFYMFNRLLKISCGLTSKVYNWTKFLTVSIYVCINCLNSFLIDNAAKVEIEAI